MNRKNDTTELAARLKDEAAENSPAFSPLLHARIMQGIARNDMMADAGPALPRRSRRIEFAALAVAASVALLLMFHFWYASSNTTRFTGPAPIVSRPPDVSVPQFAQAFDTVTVPASEQLENARFAYLDQDARHLARFMMRQVDVLPTDR